MGGNTIALRRRRLGWREENVAGRRASRAREAGVKYDAPAAQTESWLSAVDADIQRGTLQALERHATNGSYVVVRRGDRIVRLRGAELEQEITRLRALLSR